MDFYDMRCVDCSEPFRFSACEKKFLLEKGVRNTPKRCYYCRVKLRANKRRIYSFQFSAVECHQCTATMQMPFKPIEPVLCTSCLCLPEATATSSILQRIESSVRACVELSDSPVLVDPLTVRETEVLTLIVQGQTNIEISKRLFISLGAAKAHVRSILSKLNVSDRTQAAVYAVENRLV